MPRVKARSSGEARDWQHGGGVECCGGGGRVDCGDGIAARVRQQISHFKLLLAIAVGRNAGVLALLQVCVHESLLGPA